MGCRIRERRELLRMSQEDLSLKSGVSRQTISGLENTPGKNVSTKTLEKNRRSAGDYRRRTFFYRKWLKH